MPSLTLLYDTPPFVTFPAGEGGREALQRVLDHNYRHTIVSPPSGVADVRLNPRTKKTMAGLRYTSTALFAVCRVCAPGLSSVVTHLAGDARPNDRRRDLFSLDTACNVFNQVADLRYGPLLSQCRFVIDESRGTIDGVLGPRTHYLENSSFVELTEGILTDTAEVTFAGASMVGRRLFLRYYEPEQIVTSDGIYRRGFAFCVSEAGDDAIRSYRLYEHVDSGGCCLQIPHARRQKQKRTGSKFANRLRQMLVGVLQAKPVDVAASVQRLQASLLFSDSGDEQHVKSVVRGWRRRLRLSGLPADIADGVSSAPFGFDNPEASPLTTSALATKTEYDLFKAAMLDSTNRSQRLREVVERSVFSVFLQD